LAFGAALTGIHGVSSSSHKSAQELITQGCRPSKVFLFSFGATKKIQNNTITKSAQFFRVNEPVIKKRAPIFFDGALSMRTEIKLKKI
jgi:hypothetical protein